MKLQPIFFKMEENTVWNFPERGHWATHNGEYRGNWSPYVPRNLILRYTVPGEWVLDQFLGSGTTLIEAKLLNRNAIGIDISRKALELALKGLTFECNSGAKVFVRQGNATNLHLIGDEKIDFICTHPPYLNIIKYSNDTINDISNLSIEEFLDKIHMVAKESYRVLKNNKYCAIMMGDIRKNGCIYPLGFKVMDIFLTEGFCLKEVIIKKQNNCSSTKYWKSKKPKFLLLAHEYIFVFQKQNF